MAGLAPPPRIRCNSLNSTSRTGLARLHVSDTGLDPVGDLSVLAIFRQSTAN